MTLTKIITGFTSHTAKVIYSYIAAGLVTWGALQVNFVSKWAKSFITLPKKVEYLDSTLKQYIKQGDIKDSIIYAQLKSTEISVKHMSGNIWLLEKAVSSGNEDIKKKIEEYKEYQQNFGVVQDTVKKNEECITLK